MPESLIIWSILLLQAIIDPDVAYSGLIKCKQSTILNHVILHAYYISY